MIVHELSPLRRLALASGRAGLEGVGGRVGFHRFGVWKEEGDGAMTKEGERGLLGPGDPAGECSKDVGAGGRVQNGERLSVVGWRTCISTLRLAGLTPSSIVLAGERLSGGSSAFDGASGGVHCSSRNWLRGDAAIVPERSGCILDGRIGGLDSCLRAGARARE